MVIIESLVLVYLLAGLDRVRKLALGVCGDIAYAWRRLPEEQLADMTPRDRRSLAWYCVFQGVVGLALGAAISVGCAWPLVRMALA